MFGHREMKAGVSARGIAAAAVAIALAIGIACFAGPGRAEAITQSEASAHLESITQAYKNTYWTTDGRPCASSSNCHSNYYYGKQCKGFANWVFDQVFGGGYIGSYSSDKSYIPSPSGASLLARCAIGTVSAAAVQDAFSGAAPGDFIQMRRSGKSYGHSMILLATGSDGIRVLECNDDGHCGVHENFHSWSSFASKNSGFSVYRADGYSMEPSFECAIDSPSPGLPFEGSVVAYGWARVGYTPPTRVVYQVNGGAEREAALYTRDGVPAGCAWRVELLNSEFNQGSNWIAFAADFPDGSRHYIGRRDITNTATFECAIDSPTAGQSVDGGLVAWGWARVGYTPPKRVVYQVNGGAEREAALYTRPNVPDGCCWRVEVPASAFKAGDNWIAFAADFSDGRRYIGSRELVKSVRTVPKPEAVAGLVYNGNEQVGVAPSDGYTLSGDFSATNAGKYLAVAALADGCVWADGSTEDVWVEWSIAKAAGNSVDAEGKSFIYDGTDHAIDVPEASQKGSTILYSFDGRNWSEEMPLFLSAGEYVLHVKVVNPNYEDVAAVVPVNVEKAKLTVAYVSETGAYGEAPKGEVLVTGFATSEDPEHLGSDYVAPTVTMPASLEVNKSYVLTPAGGKSSDYEFEYVPGTLSVDVDKSGLRDAIGKASEALATTRTSLDGADVPEGERWVTPSRDALLETELARASSYLESGDQVAVEDAAKNLETALEDFEADVRYGTSGTAEKARNLERIALASTSATYDGKAHKPSVAYVFAADGEVNAESYTVSYLRGGKKTSDFRSAGSITVVVTGKGSCAGTKKASFTIAKANMKNATASKMKAQKYKKGKAVKPTLKLTYKGKTLKKGADYTLAYKDNKKRGIATLTGKGKGNFKGTKTLRFKIK
ncbi:MAG: hypothetical protein IJ087_09735 [Eggerthellaceae bacterium]|nr:hypothetical protein [Eggerthellaceae bacterium]